MSPCRLGVGTATAILSLLLASLTPATALSARAGQMQPETTPTLRLAAPQASELKPGHPDLTATGPGAKDAGTWSVHLPSLFADFDPGVCYDQRPTDLSSPGNPPLGVRRGPDITYDPQRFDVYTRTMHSRVVAVAIEKGFILQDPTGKVWEEEELAEFIFRTWAIFWQEFGGFPWESYTVVLGHDLPFIDVGAFPLGHGQSQLRTPWIAHEIYHAWAGCDFRQEGERSWYMEGVTTYYGDLRGTSENPFEKMAREFYHYYLDYFDSGQDRALADMSMNDPDYNHTFVAVKGAVVAYLMDLELAGTGHHLGEVSRLLYERYGMGREGTPTNEQILSAVNDVSGTDFSGFFDRYVYGTEKLPLLDETDFSRVCHD